MRHHLGRRLLVLLAGLMLVAAACGGGDQTAEESPTDAAETEPGDDETGAAGDVSFDVGVTEEPCPDAVNEDNGCIYLGILSDLTEGPFSPVSVPVTDAQKAFWQRVNEQGGIGGAFDVDVEQNIGDNKYNPEVHNQLYQEMKPNILALAQSLGSPTTAAIIDDMLENEIVGTPGGWTSLYDTDEPGKVILESGGPYCVEAMNGVDYYAEQEGGVDSVLAVHVPGDYGDDGAAGAKLAAEANEAEFNHVEVGPTASGGELRSAINAIVNGDPDVVIVYTTPGQLGEIAGTAVSEGYDGRFIASLPAWNPALLDSPAGEALQQHVWQTRMWGEFDAESPGHQAMRDALPDDSGIAWAYTSGWVWSYPLKDALELAYENGDLTRDGLFEAVNQLETVDYEGMLPEEAGNFAGDPNDQVFRQHLIAEPDPDAREGVRVIEDFFEGPTAADFTFEGACYQTIDLDS